MRGGRMVKWGGWKEDREAVRREHWRMEGESKEGGLDGRK